MRHTFYIVSLGDDRADGHMALLVVVLRLLTAVVCATSASMKMSSTDDESKRGREDESK